MALSEHEQRLLDEMERSLYSNEADFVSTTPTAGPSISGRSVLLVIITVAVGLGIIVAGMALGQPWIGILGFVAMIVGIGWLLKPGTSTVSADESTTTSAGTPPRATPRTGAKGRPLMDRLEDRWERRRDGEL